MDGSWTLWLAPELAVRVDRDGEFEVLDVGPRGVTLLRDREPLPVEELSEDAEPRDAAACGDTRFAVLDAGNAAVLVFRLDGAEEIPYLEGALGSAGYELEQPVAVGTAAGAEYEAVAVIDRSASEDNHALHVLACEGSGRTLLSSPLPAAADDVVAGADPVRVCAAFDAAGQHWWACVGCGAQLCIWPAAAPGAGQGAEALGEPSVVDDFPASLGPLTASAHGGGDVHVVATCGAGRVARVDLRRRAVEVASVDGDVVAVRGGTCLLEDGLVEPWARSGGGAVAEDSESGAGNEEEEDEEEDEEEEEYGESDFEGSDAFEGGEGRGEEGGGDDHASDKSEDDEAQQEASHQHSQGSSQAHRHRDDSSDAASRQDQASASSPASSRRRFAVSPLRSPSRVGSAAAAAPAAAESAADAVAQRPRWRGRGLPPPVDVDELYGEVHRLGKEVEEARARVEAQRRRQEEAERRAKEVGDKRAAATTRIELLRAGPPPSQRGRGAGSGQRRGRASTLDLRARVLEAQGDLELLREQAPALTARFRRAKEACTAAEAQRAEAEERVERVGARDGEGVEAELALARAERARYGAEVDAVRREIDAVRRKGERRVSRLRSEAESNDLEAEAIRGEVMALRARVEPYDARMAALRRQKESLQRRLRAVEGRQDVVADAFARYDRDGSGFLEASEVVQAVAEIGEVVEGEGAGSSLADRAAALIAEHDQNGDGRLSLREFVRVIEGVL